MKTQIKQPGSVSHTIQSKTQAARQAPANKVLQQYKENTLQRAEIPEEEDELLQGKFETTQREEIDEEELLQGKFESVENENNSQLSVVNSQLNNTGLPDDLKSGIENLSGYSMNDVRVHYNSPKPAQLQALAYTQGTDIHVAPGQEKHLPHEAWHVVQQMQGRVQPTTQLQGVNINDNEGLEKEADRMGEEIFFSSNNFSNLQTSMPNTKITQARFYPPLPTDGVQWNTLIDQIEQLHARVQLPNKIDIDSFIIESESNWNGEEIHVASIIRFNAFYTLKAKVKTGLEQIKINRIDASTYNWGDFISNLQLMSQKYGNLTGPRRTGGHSADSYTYTVNEQSVIISEENDTHGRTQGNLNTRRGEMRNAIDLYNGAIDADKAFFN